MDDVEFIGSFTASAFCNVSSLVVSYGGTSAQDREDDIFLGFLFFLFYVCMQF